MNKSLTSLISEASQKWRMWQNTAMDTIALRNRNKTKEEAIILASYFEGRFDALCDARSLSKEKLPCDSISELLRMVSHNEPGISLERAEELARNFIDL